MKLSDREQHILATYGGYSYDVMQIRRRLKEVGFQFCMECREVVRLSDCVRGREAICRPCEADVRRKYRAANAAAISMRRAAERRVERGSGRGVCHT